MIEIAEFLLVLFVAVPLSAYLTTKMATWGYLRARYRFEQRYPGNNGG